jgi:hypothetical protein
MSYIDFADNGGRRLRSDERQFSYTGCIPERRSGKERRSGLDRRETLMQRASNERRSTFKR